MDKRRDQELGMSRKISRRDFLNGFALTLGAAITPSPLFALDEQTNPEKSAKYYPPALTGLRGSHPGSFDAAHSLRDGTFWDHAGKPTETGETYDLVVVGGGISGLSAAHYFRKVAGARARVLILDNHDDFGGHAKRNQFRVGNQFRLGYGGTFSIDSTPASGRGYGTRYTVPTINLASYPELLPANGVYVTTLRIGGGVEAETFEAVTNVGNRPTFGADSFAVESHLLNFHPVDLSESTPLRLTFLKRLRAEQRFPSPEALVGQIRTDVLRARRYFNLCRTLQIND